MWKHPIWRAELIYATNMAAACHSTVATEPLNIAAPAAGDEFHFNFET